VSYQVFARKYRPRTFAELLGQDHVRKTLENAIAQDRLAHAYLFVGPRGTGKTSTARIFAKALNCPGGPSVDFDPDDPLCIEIAEGRALDVLEIDGATNNGVEQVRQLRETVAYAPASGRFKIYYIDEVHMLSNAAFNALLKTLEEPPPHVKFIFATTEAHKVLPTIVSRCQRFDLRRIPQGIIAENLLHIAREEQVQLDDLAAHSIARGAEGGMRDAQSMLDQLVAFCGEHITEEDVLEVFGFTAHHTIVGLSSSLLAEDTAPCLQIIGQQAEAGKDLQRLLTDLISWIRRLLVYGIDPDNTIKDAAPEVASTLAEQGGKVGNDRLLSAMDALAEAEARMRWAPDKKMHFEVAMVKACRAIGATAISDIIQMLGDGDPPASPPATGTGGGGNKEKPSAPATPATPATPAADKKTKNKSAETPPAPEAKAEPQHASLAATMAEVASAKAEPLPGVAGDATEENSDDTPESSKATTSCAAAADPVPDSELWTRALACIQSQRPLVAAWAEDAQEAGIEKDTLTLEFAAEAMGSLQSLERPATRDQILEILCQTAGRKISLKLILNEDLEPPVVAPEATHAEAGNTEEEKTPAPADAAGSEHATAPAEDFYDDPLVKDAMEVFAAELENRDDS